MALSFLRTSTKGLPKLSRSTVFLNHFAPKSSQSQSQISTADNSDRTGITQKPRTNVPFAKNLFLGDYDKNMLIFPEALSKEELEDLEEMTKPVERFFSENVDSKAIDTDARIPDEVMKTLKDLGLFGQQIPQEYGGLGMNATKYARMSEFTALDSSISTMLGAHQSIGLKGILLFGTEAQKHKYLPKLATGEHIAAFCLTEAGSGSDAASIQTQATISPDGTHYILNGSKIWVSNGGIADIFTVLARIENTNAMGESEHKITAFIVERGFGGVTSGKPEDKHGIRGCNTSALYFDNTPVPVENILGEVGGGFNVAVNVINTGRFSLGSAMAGSLRKLIGLAAEHAITRAQFGKKLKDFGLIQKKFARMAIATYTMESMAYMTAAIMDSYDIPDISVEAAMVKVFSSENTWEMTSECLQIFGGMGYMKDYPYERMLRDSRICLIFEGTNEVLRLFIALSCLQYAGNELGEMVRKFKDPLNNVGFVVSKMFERMKKNANKPRLTMKLYNDVHPVLGPDAECLEKRVLQFSSVVETYLSLYRDKIVEEQMALEKMADIAIDLYACNCNLARATRSKAIGLKSCDHEISLTKSFVHEAMFRIDEKLQKLKRLKTGNTDEAYRLIAEDIFKAGGYAADHPLKRNW